MTLMWSWHDRDLDQLAILARDVERSNRMQTSKDMNYADIVTNAGGTLTGPAPRHPYVNWNSWNGKNASQWWAEARAATTTDARDEAISVARWLQEQDDMTARFENLPIIQRYRAAVKREQGHP